MGIEDIVAEAGLSSRAGYYAGRPEEYGDIDLKILNKIADSIQKEFGDKAHKSFVQMVWDSPNLTASAFLYNLYNLKRADWKLKKIKLSGSGNHIDNHGEAFGLVTTVLVTADKETNQLTDSIRNGFRKN